jgi:hypothetical protein
VNAFNEYDCMAFEPAQTITGTGDFSSLDLKGLGIDRKVTFTMDFSDPFPPDDYLNTTWTLQPGLYSGGNQYGIVAMKISDQAGSEENTMYYWQIVGMDTTNPDPPASMTHSYVINEDDGSVGIQLSWERGTETGLFYRAVYPGAATGNSIVIETPANYFSFLLDGYSPNQVIPVQLSAIDTTGNESAMVEYDCYALAEPGILSPVTQGIDERDGHYMSWTLDGGMADYQVLQVLEFPGESPGETPPEVTCEVSPDYLELAGYCTSIASLYITIFL